jgi:hypothetical protein
MARKPNRVPPRVIHATPVFLDERPYWLILTRKKSAPMAQYLTNLTEDVAQWDSSVKSWRITHLRIGDAIAKIEEAIGKSFAFCEECHAGDPCNEWDDIPEMDYEPREPEELEYDADNPLEPPPPEFWEDLAHKFFDRTEPVVKKFVATAEAAFAAWLSSKRDGTKLTVKEAAEVLEVSWPCSHEEVIRAFRVKASKAHPDHGGSDAAMARVNAAREALERAEQ